MSELEETLKAVLFLLWIGYVTVMSIHGAFQAEEAVDVLVAFVVWAFVVGISASLFGSR